MGKWNGPNWFCSTTKKKNEKGDKPSSHVARNGNEKGYQVNWW